MIFAVFCGFIFFGEVPAIRTPVGTALITSGWLLVLTARE